MYSVVRALTGGTSRVYLCDEAAGEGLPARPVAVKRLNHSLAEVKDLSALFMRECYHWLRIGSKGCLSLASASRHSMPPESYTRRWTAERTPQ